MKIFFYACFIAISFAACNSSEQKSKVVAMNTKDVNLSPVIHDSLTTGQREKVRRIQKTFEEVYPVSLEETVANFKRDQNPDKEIGIWLNMASAYEKFINKYGRKDPLKRQEAFKLILLRSMMPDQEAIKEAELRVLNDEEIKDVLRTYNVGATPITTRQQ